MCTAVSFLRGDHYFGRNLDLEYSYDETVTVMPRNYPMRFRSGLMLDNHYALIGVAHVEGGYPLYYDATNEKGLSMAGLNFPVSTDYKQPVSGKDNIAPFEFTPWVLGRCANLSEARCLLERANLTEESFSEKFPLTPLHWMVKQRRVNYIMKATGIVRRIFVQLNLHKIRLKSFFRSKNRGVAYIL